MVYKINLRQVLRTFRNTIEWIIIFIVVILYTYNKDKSFIYFVCIAYLPIMIPFLLLIVQYLSYSSNKYRLSSLLSKQAEESNLVIEKFHNYSRRSDVAYLPWMAGTFYYYKISVNEKKYYVTCMMDSKKNSFEKEVGEMGINIEMHEKFYPWIRH